MRYFLCFVCTYTFILFSLSMSACYKVCMYSASLIHTNLTLFLRHEIHSTIVFERLLVYINNRLPTICSKYSWYYLFYFFFFFLRAGNSGGVLSIQSHNSVKVKNCSFANRQLATMYTYQCTGLSI